MTFEVAKNPRRGKLMEMARNGESFRAIRDPATGDSYAWPASEAMHIDMAQKLGFDFKSRRELQRNSYLFDRAQLEDAKGARDLDDLLKMIEG